VELRAHVACRLPADAPVCDSFWNAIAIIVAGVFASRRAVHHPAMVRNFLACGRKTRAGRRARAASRRGYNGTTQSGHRQTVRHRGARGVGERIRRALDERKTEEWGRPGASRTHPGPLIMKRSTSAFLNHAHRQPAAPEDLVRTMYAKEEGVAGRRRGARGAHPLGGRGGEFASRRARARRGQRRRDVQALLRHLRQGRLAGFGGTGNTFVYQDSPNFRISQARVRRSGRSRRKTRAATRDSVRDPKAAVEDVDN